MEAENALSCELSISALEEIALLLLLLPLNSMDEI